MVRHDTFLPDAQQGVRGAQLGTEQRRDRRSGASKEKAGRDGGGRKEVVLAFPSRFERG
jgi:hypothetical protein